MANKILLCEDEANIVSFLRTELEYEGFEVDVAEDGNAAMAFIAVENYQLILLDVMLPEKNGLEILRELRKKSLVPVIVLTARKEVYDKVAFLNAGADDYVTKPFDTLELIARIKRNIARNKQAEQGLHICTDSYRVFVNGDEIKLTKTEFEILSFLRAHEGKVKTREEIIRAVFGDFYGESNVIDVNIKNIRAKLAVDCIRTVRGKGYLLQP
jgi:DNA-binding response OmpR family regulator